MTDTNDLIETLVARSHKVRRLPRPSLLALFWLALAAGVLLLLAIEHGVRPDLALQWRNANFTVCLAASLATGMLAAIACINASLPDRSRLWLLLPLPTLAIWLSSIGYGCLTDWVEFNAGAVQPGEALRCFSTLLLVSLPLSGAMFLLLRHAARLRPMPVVLMAGLAVAAITASAMSLLHQLDASLMILIWNLGASLLIVAVEASLGKRAMRWFGEMLAR